MSRFLGGEKYHTWKDSYYSLKHIPIPKLAFFEELKKELKKQKDIFTFSEYLQFDQFSKHGYHAKHTSHGLQPTSNKEWSQTLASLCIKDNIEHVVDFGCGDGRLGVLLVNEARKQGKNLTWTGIELNQALHKRIYELFALYKLEKNISQVVTTLEEAHSQKNTLLIFSFSLDSVPPECFINPLAQQSVPSALLGLHIKDTFLEEVLLSNEQLKAKKMSLQKGLFTDQNGRTFDLTQWALYPYQRAYIPVKAFSILEDCIAKYPHSQILIVDEFSGLQPDDFYAHISPPFNLEAYKRPYVDTKNIYNESGKNLYYYPCYMSTMVSFLRSKGFQTVRYDIEPKMIRKLKGEKVSKEKVFRYMCAAIYAKDQHNPNTTALLDPPHSLPSTE
jgi:hypothetical protein